jgi:hypothetical protein
MQPHHLNCLHMLTQNQHLAPSTQQAERSWLNTCAGSEACQSIFLKLTKDENELDKTWNFERIKMSTRGGVNSRT